MKVFKNNKVRSNLLSLTNEEFKQYKVQHKDFKINSHTLIEEIQKYEKDFVIYIDENKKRTLSEDKVYCNRLELDYNETEEMTKNIARIKHIINFERIIISKNQKIRNKRFIENSNKLECLKQISQSIFNINKIVFVRVKNQITEKMSGKCQSSIQIEKKSNDSLLQYKRSTQKNFTVKQVDFKNQYKEAFNVDNDFDQPTKKNSKGFKAIIMKTSPTKVVLNPLSQSFRIRKNFKELEELSMEKVLSLYDKYSDYYSTPKHTHTYSSSLVKYLDSDSKVNYCGSPSFINSNSFINYYNNEEIKRSSKEIKIPSKFNNTNNTIQALSSSNKKVKHTKVESKPHSIKIKQQNSCLFDSCDSQSDWNSVTFRPSLKENQNVSKNLSKNSFISLKTTSEDLNTIILQNSKIDDIEKIKIKCPLNEDKEIIKFNSLKNIVAINKATLSNIPENNSSSSNDGSVLFHSAVTENSLEITFTK